MAVLGWVARTAEFFLGEGTLIGLFLFPPTHASLHGQGPALTGYTRQCLGLLELGYTLTDLAEFPLAFKGKPLDSLSLTLLASMVRCYAGSLCTYVQCRLPFLGFCAPLVEFLSRTMDKYTAPVLYQMSTRICAGMVLVTCFGL